jgi:beta-lactamase superfamily II metal-dependent hydrolase
MSGVARRFVSTAKASFHRQPTGGARDFVLIYGDELETTGNEQNGRSEVLYRMRPGWVDSDVLGTEHPAELYFIDVGQGDAAFVVTPAGRTILVDGGRGDEAFQFLVWRYRLDQAGASPVDIDLLVLSHNDEDHIGGLAQIVAHPLLRVRRVVHSGIARFRPGVFDTALGRTDASAGGRVLLTRYGAIGELDRAQLTTPMQQWFDAVSGEPALVCEAVDAATPPLDVGDPAVKLHVLGPRLLAHPQGPAYPWFDSGDAIAHTVNGHSVVLRLDVGAVRVLLPGDLNDDGSRYLMQDVAFATNVGSHVLKAPHHGSHEFHRPFLDAVRPQVCVVSSGESPAYGHPRANFLAATGRASRSDEPLLFSTELVAVFTPDPQTTPLGAVEPVDPSNAALLTNARQRFKKNLNGLINVRTDGSRIFAARRVNAGFQFETYGPSPAAP